jgi:3-methyladenine DNA glycosylase AlkD
MAGAMDRDEVLTWLRRRGTQANVRGMARYGIVARRAYGVSMGTMQTLQKRIGVDHDLAVELWESGWHEARLLAAMVGDPARVTRREMNAWVKDFESWADCDTVCFKLWDRSPLAWEKARQWAKSPRELVKRAGFALMACLALHDKTAPDRPFLAFFPLIEKGASDERNFVKKGVSWALRSIGRRNRTLNAAALVLARRLSQSAGAAPRWVGRDAARELAGPVVRSQLARQARQAGR